MRMWREQSSYGDLGGGSPGWIFGVVVLGMLVVDVFDHEVFAETTCNSRQTRTREVDAAQNGGGGAAAYG